MRRVLHIVIGLLLIIVGLGVGIFTEAWWVTWFVGAPLAFSGVLAFAGTHRSGRMSLKEKRKKLEAWKNYSKSIHKAFRNQQKVN